MVLAVAGCTGDPEQRSAPTPTTEASPMAATTEVLGPDGLGPLTLGMGAEDARATGRIECVSAHCATYSLVDLVDPGTASGCISEELGLMAIFAPPDAATPEGVRNGMPVDEAIEAYPDAVESVNGWSVPVPGHEGRSYSWLEDDGEVAELALSLDLQTCFG